MQDKLIFAAVLIQICSLVAFSLEFVATVFGIRELRPSWAVHELIELMLIVSLLFGFLIGYKLFRDMRQRARRAEEQLGYASAAFHDLLLAKFEQWGLTRTEQDNAILIVKGFSVSEMAAVRNKSEGTIKAQNSSIYRKSGLSGRAQFVSFFLEELTADL